MKNKVFYFLQLMRLDRLHGALLLMMPTLWSLFLAAGGRPSFKLFFIFTAGSILTRGAGCVVNDFADVEFDRHVERTKTRPLAAGNLNRGHAAILFLFLLFLSFLLVLMTNRVTVMLSFAGVILLSIYPFMKRFVHIPQFFLGMAFGWGAIMAWSAVKGEVALPAVLIFCATIFWAVGYDTVYAMVDMDDDVKIGVKSTAILFGKYCWLAVGCAYLLMLTVLVILGLISGLGGFFYTGLGMVFLMFANHIKKLAGNPSKGELFDIFKSNVTAGQIILAGLILDLF